MSDRVTNAEVEDVLSSIRRLVSDDNRPGATRTDSASQTGPQSRRPVTERLVLTQALRVTDPVEPQPGSADKSTLNLSPDLSVQADPPVNSDAGQGTWDAESEGGQTVDALAADYSDDPYDFDDAEKTADTSEDAGTSDPDDIKDDAAVVIEPSAAETQPTADAKAAALNAKIAALETAIGKISDTWEPDELGESDYAGTAPQEMTWEEAEDEPEPKPFYRPTLAPVMRKVAEPEPEASEDADMAEETGPEEMERATQEFFTTRKAPVQPIEEPASQFEAETVQDIDETPVAEPAGGPDETAADEAVLGDADQLLDEDALREMIAEIVRAELQGALGERITRNVRKLVRREIHRALTAQELE